MSKENLVRKLLEFKFHMNVFICYNQFLLFSVHLWFLCLVLFERDQLYFRSLGFHLSIWQSLAQLLNISSSETFLVEYAFLSCLSFKSLVHPSEKLDYLCFLSSSHSTWLYKLCSKLYKMITSFKYLNCSFFLSFHL